MQGPKPTYPIELTTEEAKELEHLIRAHNPPQALTVRAWIILSAAHQFSIAHALLSC